MHPDSDSITAELHQSRVVAPILKHMGFNYLGNGIYHNILLQKNFDFSCYSLEGIIVHIYSEGIRAGKKEIQSNLKELLDI